MIKIECHRCDAPELVAERRATVYDATNYFVGDVSRVRFEIARLANCFVAHDAKVRKVFDEQHRFLPHAEAFANSYEVVSNLSR